MRRYDIAVTALAIDADRKWLDNVLSHFDIDGVRQSTQGVRRLLDDDAVFRLALVLRLGRELGIPVARAIPIASSLVEHGLADVGELRVSIDIHTLRTALAARLAEAVEMAVAPARGRPPLRKSRGTRG